MVSSSNTAQARPRTPRLYSVLPPAARPSLGWGVVLAVVVVIAGLSALRLLYLASSEGLQLSQDEAHYWDWSRHLDWSYYSKGPLVAWLIRLSCAACGADTMLAVRLPAVVCSALTLLGLAVLTWQVTRRDVLVLLVTAVVGTYPAFAAGALLMTIDAPFLCCWTWALVVAHHLLFGAAPGYGHWVSLGLIIGLGILAKYTMVLFIPALGLFLLLSPMHRGELRRPGVWLMGVVAGLCCVPILIWNLQHDWVTLRHVGGQAGLNTTEFGQQGGWLWLGPLEFVAGQAALLLGFWWVVWLGAMTKTLQRSEGPAEENAAWARRFLALMAASMVGTFFLFSIKTKVQLNWPVAGYLAAVPLMAVWLAARAGSVGWRRSAMIVVGLGLLLGVAVHFSVHLHAWLAPTLSPRQWDPTCRLRGWRELGVEVERLRQAMRQEGYEPVLAGTSWNLPGIVAFYLPDQPTVYHLGPAAGQRRSQYEIWRPQPTTDPEAFRGRAFLIVGPTPPAFDAAFEKLDRLAPLTVGPPGQEVATHFLTLAWGFRGFAPVTNATTRSIGP